MSLKNETGLGSFAKLQGLRSAIPAVCHAFSSKLLVLCILSSARFETYYVIIVSHDKNRSNGGSHAPGASHEGYGRLEAQNCSLASVPLHGSHERASRGGRVCESRRGVQSPGLRPRWPRADGSYSMALATKSSATASKNEHHRLQRSEGLARCMGRLGGLPPPPPPRPPPPRPPPPDLHSILPIQAGPRRYHSVYQCRHHHSSRIQQCPTLCPKL